MQNLTVITQTENSILWSAVTSNVESYKCVTVCKLNRDSKIGFFTTETQIQSYQCIKGSCIFELKERKSDHTVNFNLYKLDSAQLLLTVSGLLWHDITGISDDCILLVYGNAPFVLRHIQTFKDYEGVTDKSFSQDLQEVKPDVVTGAPNKSIGC